MKHLEIPFEEGFVRLRTPETFANLAKVSPTGLVPVLNHNGRIIWETLAILEYLADLFPEKKLWPADIGARALARSAATEMHSGFREVRYGWPMNLRRPKGHKPLDAEGEAQRARIEALWRECREKYGKGGPFLFGHFTAADAMYAPVVTRFDTYGGDAGARYPRLCRRRAGNAGDATLVCGSRQGDLARAWPRRIESLSGADNRIGRGGCHSPCEGRRPGLTTAATGIIRNQMDTHYAAG